jgi:hypothetical protein
MMSSRTETGSDIGEEARRYRTLTRSLLVLTLVLGIAAIAALRGALPRELATPALYFVLATSLAAAWCGWKGHRIAIEQRERASRSGMLVLIAAQLARQDDAALETMVKRGGPAAEAAAMVLAGRARKPGGLGSHDAP